MKQTKDIAIRLTGQVAIEAEEIKDKSGLPYPAIYLKGIEVVKKELENK